MTLQLVETPPRISGNLNNCALNCALPHLLTSIQQIDSNAPQDTSYELLKAKFEQWYGVTLTWEDLKLLLSRFTFNEIELIMAPVLRLFIAEKTEENERANIRDIIEQEGQGIPQDVIDAYSAMGIAPPTNPPGRYVSLDSYTADRLFYSHFGLHMKVHEYMEGSDDEYQLTANANGGIGIAVDVYLKEGHYELQKYSKRPLHDFKDVRIEAINERISSDLSADASNRALADLLPLISGQISEAAPQSPTHRLITPTEYIENVANFKLHNDSIEGKLTYAIVLLTLMQSIPETKDYANRKLAGHYSLQNPQEILALLNETLVKAENPDAIYADSNTSDGLNEEAINPILAGNTFRNPAQAPSAKSISKAKFNEILEEYQTSYYFLNIFVYIFSFGCYKHESETIKALKTLSENESITAQMVHKALLETNGDSQQQRRFDFWHDRNNNYFDDYSGTDKVLSKLKTTFKNTI